MIDRELLELAAKAAGLEVAIIHDFMCIPRESLSQHRREGDWMIWDPLENDCDALRLAVQCGIEISTVDDEPGADGRYCRACAGYTTEDNPRVHYVFEDHRGDLFAATRRAITHAAAEIGSTK